jgi:hypothetical protein
MFQRLGVEVKTRTLKTAGMRHPVKRLRHPARGVSALAPPTRPAQLTSNVLDVSCSNIYFQLWGLPFGWALVNVAQNIPRSWTLILQ